MGWRRLALSFFALGTRFSQCAGSAVAEADPSVKLWTAVISNWWSTRWNMSHRKALSRGPENLSPQVTHLARVTLVRLLPPYLHAATCSASEVAVGR